METNSVVTGAASCVSINNRIAELMGAVFANRDDAYTSVQLLSSWQGRKGKQDSSKCGGGGITVICESAVKSVQIPKKVGDSSIGAVNAAGEPVYLNKMERASTVCGFRVRVNLRSAGTWAVSKTQDPTTLRHSVLCTTRVRPSCREITHTLGSIVSNDRTVSGKAIAGDARAAGLLQSNTSSKTNKPEYHRVMRAVRGIRDVRPSPTIKKHGSNTQKRLPNGGDTSTNTSTNKRKYKKAKAEPTTALSIGLDAP